MHPTRLSAALPFVALLAPPLAADVVVAKPTELFAAAARWSASIPADPALLGGRFFDQVLSLEPGANAFGAVVSAGGEARIGG